MNTTVSAASLSNGAHVFHIRFRQNNNLWSSVLSQSFTKTNSALLDLKIPISDNLQFNNDNTIFFSPNPNNGQFTIGVDEEMQVKNIIIRNNYGQVVYSINNKLKTTTWEVDLKNKAQGVYYVEVSDGKKNYTEKIVIGR